VFTGIVEAACSLAQTREDEGRRRLTMDLGPLRALDAAEGRNGAVLASLGDSVAINGVCLTVAALDDDQVAFDVIPETLGRTNLGSLEPGARVNVERALRFGDRVDGHLVQGHVEGTGVLAARTEADGELRLRVQCGRTFARTCLPKGSVTVDGVSLTVAELGDEHFVVALVPHTLERTTLGELREGDRVNLEPDMIGQWVLRAAQLQSGD